MLESLRKRRLQEISTASVPTTLSHDRLDHKREAPYATFWIKRYWRLDSRRYCGYCSCAGRSGADAFADLRGSFTGFVNVGSRGNGKGHVSTRFNVWTSHLCELVGQVVKGASEVLNNVASCGKKVETRNGQRAEIGSQLSRLRIGLHASYLKLLPPSGIDFGLQLQ